jgi:tRNA-2-methylthio-N6-dimethylallyladenosine synthase
MTCEQRSTVYVETYGCQMNVSDSELMLGKLAAHGYDQVDRPDAADVILVNTCAIREHAEQRVIGRLGELRRDMKPGAIVGVTGCMAQRLGPQLLKKAKHVSVVLGPDGYRALPDLIDRARQGERTIATTFDLEEHYEDFQPRRFDKVKAWIPVQRGCDYRCTYCIVPTTRGPERSRKLADVRREVESVVAEGMTEVVLLGQTVNSYHDGDYDFADLLRAVGTVPGIRRVRFTSPHPNDFSDRVIEAMATVETVCEHVHLPMQSGSTQVLKRMLRRYTREGYPRLRGQAARGNSRSFRDDRRDRRLSGRDGRGFRGNARGGARGRLRRRFHLQVLSARRNPGDTMPAELTVPDEVASERLARFVETIRGIARTANLSNSAVVMRC